MFEAKALDRTTNIVLLISLLRQNIKFRLEGPEPTPTIVDTDTNTQFRGLEVLFQTETL